MWASNYQMNILLIGKNGQLGQTLIPVLSPLGHLIALERANLDLTNSSALQQALHTHQPNLIVNAAAYTAVDNAEIDVERAYQINAQAVGIMADYARQHDSLIIHYSTDYVFNGDTQAPYSESDDTQPLNVYGESKRLGEQYILQSGCHSLIFRISWLFSSHGHNFVKTILSLAQSRETLSVVDDQQGTPTSTALVAKVTQKAIMAYYNQGVPSGLYHLSAKGSTSWHGFATYVIQCAQKNGITLTLRPEQICPISTKDYPTRAQRPLFSCLNTELLSNRLKLMLPDWTVGVQQVVNELTPSERLL